MEEIINKLESIISNIFNITIEELRDNRKLRSHTDARSILFYFLHVKYGISFYRLSKIYNKHHSTIIRAVNKCEYLKNYDFNLWQILPKWAVECLIFLILFQKLENLVVE